jgi:hypothetical protein
MSLITVDVTSSWFYRVRSNGVTGGGGLLCIYYSEGGGSVVKERMVRGIIAGSAVLIPFGGVMALAAKPAAATHPDAGITCAKWSAKSTPTAFTVFHSGCSGNTGGKGRSFQSPPSARPLPTKWANGKSTSYVASNIYFGTRCVPSSTLLDDEVISGNVTADNTGSTKYGASVNYEECIYSTSTTNTYKFTEAPGTEFVISP